MNAEEISKKTGIAKNHVYTGLKAIRELSFVPRNIKAILSVSGRKIVITENRKEKH